MTFELAWALNQVRRWDEALGYFRAALALRPDSSAAYNGLGEILRSMGRVDEAIDSLEQALRLDPRNMLAHYNLAFALHSKGQFDGAIDHFQQALSIAPNSAALHNNLGMALEDRGRLDEAIEHLRQSVRIKPKSAFGQINLGMALYAKGGWTRPSTTCSKPSTSTPITPSPTRNLAVLLRARGRVAEAIEHLQQAVRLEGQKPTRIRRRLVHDRYEAACANVQSAAGQGTEDCAARRAGASRQPPPGAGMAASQPGADRQTAQRRQGAGDGRSPPGYPTRPWPASVTRRRWRSCPTPSASRGGGSGRTWRRVSPPTRSSKGGSAPPDGNGIGRLTAMRGA